MTRAKREPDLSTYSGRFAARLRELREKAKLSQAEAADRLGVKQNTVSRWETGVATPSVDLYSQIATVYNVAVRNILPKN